MVRLLTALLLGVALVLMHHLVGTPHEALGVPAAAITIEGHAPGVHDHGTDDRIAGDRGTGVPADAPHGDHASMVLHLCLAVLVALGTAVLFLVGARWRGRPGGADDDAVDTLAVTTVLRPPPTPVRLARLQVLRL